MRGNPALARHVVTVECLDLIRADPCNRWLEQFWLSTQLTTGWREMAEVYTMRYFLLDTVCQLTRIVSESTIRKVEGLSNTIGGPSRGVLIVGHRIRRAFEKSVIWGRHGDSQKIRKTGVAMTQVGGMTWGYDATRGEEKILTG